MNKIDVLVILDVVDLKDKDILEENIKKDGFCLATNEDFVYTIKCKTTIELAKDFILYAFKNALFKTEFKGANLIFLLDETPYVSYFFNKIINNFELSKVEK